MPIHIGTSSLNQQKISLGDTQYQKVYVGDKLVWQKITSSPITFSSTPGIYYAQQSNPVTKSISFASNVTFVVLTIKSVGFSGKRVYGVPTLGGVEMTQVGDYVNNGLAEMWYMNSPPTGSVILSVPNSGLANLHIVISGYICAKPVVLESYKYNLLSVGSLLSTNCELPIGKNLLVTDSGVIYTGTSINYLSYSDQNIFIGVLGAVFGSLSQRKLISNNTLDNYSMWCNFTTSHTIDHLVAVFSGT